MSAESTTPSTTKGNRFFTFNSVIRVNQIEVARDRTEGFDEREFHTPEAVARMRQAVADGWPGAKMTWALSWLALFDESQAYRDIRSLVRTYHDTLGDDVTFIPGGFFANAYNTREQVNRDLHDGLARVSEFMGEGFRPQSVVAGFLAAENQRFLAEEEDIHVCQGNIWSQYAIDNQDGDGSICYPFYPSREHFCKPAQAPDGLTAQGAGDFIDCVNLDGWTVDFLAGRRPGGAEGFNSRMGVGPIETFGWFNRDVALAQILSTTAAHFDTGFSLNDFAWVTVCWEVSLLQNAGWAEGLTMWLEEMRSRWPETQFLTQGEFGNLWRKDNPDNSKIDLRFVQRGSGITGSDYDSEIRWFMNCDFRLALLRDWRRNGPERVIDFTRYDLPASEPQDMTRKWSLMGQINQKGTRPQDAPVPLAELPKEDVERIVARYPELA